MNGGKMEKDGSLNGKGRKQDRKGTKRWNGMKGVKRK
jgi:hypothetical protein